MYYTIYKITNTINGKYYIGKHQTFDLQDGYMGSGKYLKRAMDKYGIENFTKEILHIFKTEKEMNDKEKELVVISEETYNLNEGGTGGFTYINSKGLNIANGKKGSERFQKMLKENPDFYQKWHKNVTAAQKTESYRTKQSEQSKRKHREGLCTHHQLNTPEAIAKKKDIYKTIKHQQGHKNSQYGTCWITNGKENKKIKKEELDNYISLGYTKGRIM
jgi:hypothetical protein